MDVAPPDEVEQNGRGDRGREIAQRPVDSSVSQKPLEWLGKGVDDQGVRTGLVKHLAHGAHESLPRDGA